MNLRQRPATNHVLLPLLPVMAEEFGLDVVLGAFLAGVVLRRWAPGDVHALEGKLDAITYGFFIPLFFVASGMSLDVRSIAEAPLPLLMFFVLLLVVRGCRLIAVRRGSAIVFPTAGPTARFCEKGGRVIAGAAGGPLATGWGLNGIHWLAALIRVPLIMVAQRAARRPARHR